jgi:hypothetical protein
VKDLAGAARAAREKLGEEPKSLLVIDGATSAEETSAALPPGGESGADVFVVAEKPLGTVDAEQVCDVSPVPRHGARRIAAAMLRGQPEAKPPAVRTMDGLAVTASLAARAALAYQGKEGPLSIDDARSAMQRMVRLVARHPTALELLLILSVAHPVGLPLDSLVGALAHVRQGRGAVPTQEESGSGVMWLAHAGILEPLDEQRFSMHPILQENVRAMTASPNDLTVARDALSVGLAGAATAAIGPDGVDLPRAALHQLRFVCRTSEGEAKARTETAIAKVETALGVRS